MALPSPDEIADAVAAAASDPEYHDLVAALGGTALITASIVATVATFGAASVALSTVRRTVEASLWVAPYLYDTLMDFLDIVFDFLAGITGNLVDAAASAANAGAQAAGDAGGHAIEAFSKTGNLAGRWIVQTTGIDHAAQAMQRTGGVVVGHVGKTSEKAMGHAGEALGWVGANAQHAARKGQAIVAENVIKPVGTAAAPFGEPVFQFASAINKLIASGPDAVNAVLGDPAGFASALAASLHAGGRAAIHRNQRAAARFAAPVASLAGESPAAISAILANPTGFAAALASSLASGASHGAEQAQKRVGRMNAQIAKLARNASGKK